MVCRTLLTGAGLMLLGTAAAAQTFPRVVPYENAAGLEISMDDEGAPAGPAPARLAAVLKLLEGPLGTPHPGAPPATGAGMGGTYAQVARRYDRDPGFIHLLVATDRTGAVCHIRAKPGPETQAAIPGALGRCAAEFSHPPQPSPDVHVGTSLVDLPGGWDREDKSDGIVLRRTLLRRSRPDEKPGMALIVVTQPKPATPAFDDAFQAFAGTLQALRNESPFVKGSGATVNGHRIRWQYRCCGKGSARVGAWTVGVEGAAGHSFLQLVTINAPSDDDKALEAVFQGIVRSLRPSGSDQAFALMPSGKGGLDGLYSHLDTGLRLNPLGGMGFYSEQDPVLFDGTGLFSRNLPGGETLTAACQRKPVGCGTYTLAGSGAVEMVQVGDGFGTMQAEHGHVEADGAIKLGDKLYSRVPPFAGPLQGTWNSTFAQSGTIGTGSTSVFSSHSLSFTRDGRFSRTGASGFSSSTTIGDSTTGVSGGSERPAEGGTYRLSGYTLALTGRDGRTEILSLFAPDPGSDGLLVINGSNYLKEGR